MLDFTGKTVLVTGGGRGVGRAVARSFAKHGATVVINCFHSLEEARRTEAELRGLGATAHLIRASVAKRPQVARMFAELTELTGGLDILINNAAAGALLPPSEVRDEHWRRAWDTNVLGSLWCSQFAAPLMEARGGGAIVNMSSLGAGFVVGNYATVGTTKAALESLTRYLAVQYAPMNIRVNTASCGLIDEGAPARLFPQAEELMRVGAGATPMGRLATEDDLANIVIVLASDLTGWVTGQTLLADGGLSLASTILSPPPADAGTEDAPVTMRIIGSGAGDGASRHTTSNTVPAPTAAPAVDPDEAHPDNLIAVVGMGAVFAGANSPAEFWRLRLSGEAMFSEPGGRWDADTFYSPDPDAEDLAYSRKAGFIHGFRPLPLLAADPRWSGEDPAREYTSRWLRHALLQALDGVRRDDRTRIACHFGHCADGSQHLEETLVAASIRRRLHGHIAAAADASRADEVIRTLDAGLPLSGGRPWKYLPHVIVRDAIEGILPPRATVIDTACSSSLYALDVAIRDLVTGACDMAVCGGAYAIGPRNPVLFAKLQGLSKAERVLALDRDRDGVLFADGAGVVVLKKARRARADGDRILGYIAGIGTSSDGKGKAIYAPNGKGQRLAITRAQYAAGIPGDQVQWVAAHATGTLAGDLTEFRTLQETVGAGAGTCYVTSNKSQIGHTGWAAGVASLIEVLLGFEHATIPPQQQFDRPPDEFTDPPTRLEIPTTPHPWPRLRDLPRIAAVSAFGFGGTNAHVVLTDRPPRAASTREWQAPRTKEPIAVVGWSTCLPGLIPDNDVASWLRGQAPPPPVRFDDDHPLPSLTSVRIPPRTLRTVDRCQLMILECAERLRPALGGMWAQMRDMTGVIAGHMGPTRTATLYTVRCYLSHLERVLGKHPELDDDPAVRDAFAAFGDEIRRLALPGSEETLPGGTPNTIPARVANYFDFQGVNITVDTGVASTIGAIETAMGYLRMGELDLAMVCGINGNTTAEFIEVLSADGGLGTDVEPAEGAFMFALTRESTAREHDLPILGLLYDSAIVDDRSAASTRIDGAQAAGRPHYLGGELARALLASVVGSTHSTLLTACDPFTGRTDRLLVEKPTAGDAGPADRAERQASRPDQVLRHVVRLRPEALPTAPAPAPAVITSGTLVMTDDGPLAERLTQTGGMVLCVEKRTNEQITAMLEDVTRPVTGLAIVTPLRENGDEGDENDTLLSRQLRLHDAAFIALRTVHEDLIETAGAFYALLLDAARSGVMNPLSGLFTGLVKAAGWELPGCRATAVLTDSGDLDAGLARLAAEAQSDPPVAVAVHDDSGRRVQSAIEQAMVPSGDLGLDRESMVVATGGARGVTAEVLVALAERTGARIWVLGANDLDDYPEWVFEGTEAEFAARHPELLREFRRTHPDLPPVAGKRRLERMRDARQARTNLRRMAAHSGVDRVRYLACDVTDPGSVFSSIAAITADGKPIDLLVHGAGVNRSGALANKDLEEFRRIRDVKVLGYANLKSALRNCAPKLWCNFGSVIGYAGQPGELDYAAANDFLAAAARHATTGTATRELTIDWPLWKSVGFAANPLVQEYLSRNAEFDGMETDEGVAHFLAELAAPQADHEVLYVSTGQRAALERHDKGRFGAARTNGGRATAKTVSTPLLGSRTESGPGTVCYERTLSVDTDAYLNEHKVRGFPTVPGTFMLEMAAEVATRLVPETCVTSFSGVRFEAFLRPETRAGRRPVGYRVLARVAAADPEETRVQVEVLTDVHAPSGVLLRKDRRHFVCTVHVRTHPVTPVPWRRPTVGPPITVLSDPHVVPNDQLLLSGVFRTNHSCQRHEGGSEALFRTPVEHMGPIFDGFHTPALLLDGLLRVVALNAAVGECVPLLAPLKLGRIDLFDSRNDVELGADYPQGISMHCRPAGTEYAGRTLDSDLFAAVGPENKILIEVSDVEALKVGLVDLRTGLLRTEEPVDAS